jgi:hypothetical protein
VYRPATLGNCHTSATHQSCDHWTHQRVYHQSRQRPSCFAKGMKGFGGGLQKVKYVPSGTQQGLLLVKATPQSTTHAPVLHCPSHALESLALNLGFNSKGGGGGGGGGGSGPPGGGGGGGPAAGLLEGVGCSQLRVMKAQALAVGRDLG